MAKRAQSGQSGDAGKGKALLSAVERLVEKPEVIRASAEERIAQARASLPRGASEAEVRRAAERRIVADYSNRTAFAGGAAALPALIPGLGSLAALVGGGLADMTFCLKYEVEMALSLAAIRGYDIEDARERQLAYLLIAAHTYEASSGKSALADLVKAEWDAVFNYTPRQLGKLIGALFVRLAILFAGKGLTRALPLVGVIVNSAANKALTRRVGTSVIAALDRREALRGAKKNAAPRKPVRARRAAKGARKASA